MQLQVMGQERKMCLPTGKVKTIIRLNNAATTPPLLSTMEKINSFMENYGALHRGAGPHASKTMEEYENALQEIRKFISIQKEQEIIFTENTTAAINQLVRMLHLSKKQRILTTDIEHTSNYLPWKFNTKAKVFMFKVNNDCSFNLDQVKHAIESLHPTIVSITGGHNLTGYIPPIKEIADITHAEGGKLFVDCAQLAPHRPLNLKENGIDFAAFSSHKIYSPFGIGVLVVQKEILNGLSVNPGGGTVEMIGDNRIIWSEGVKKHQSGTPNANGVIALAETIKTINKVGWERIIHHEKELTEKLVKGMQEIPKIKTYFPLETYTKGNENRTGALAFNIEGVHHSLIGSILENEFAIESRSGTICNHRLVRKWMNISTQAQELIEQEMEKGNLLKSYGIVRVSIGAHNTAENIESFIEALNEIVTRGPALSYKAYPKEEAFKPIASNALPHLFQA